VISLLNCLGKVSKRILAKRLNSLAESGPLLHDSEIGKTKKKSAVDIALLLTKFVEKRKLLMIMQSLRLPKSLLN
jgi:hypothetical protein